MTIEQLFAFLKAAEGGTDALAFVKTLVGNHKKELTKLQNKLTAAEGGNTKVAGKLQKVLDKLNVEVSDDEDFDLEDAVDETIKAVSKNGQSTPEIAELQKQLKTLTRNLDKLTVENTNNQKLAGEEKAKRHKMLVDSEVLSALIEGKANKPQVLKSLVGQKVKVNENDELVYLADNGDEISVKDGVKSWLDANPEFVANDSNAGAGGHGGGKGKDGPVAKMHEIAEQRNKGLNLPQPSSGGLDPWKK